MVYEKVAAASQGDRENIPLSRLGQLYSSSNLIREFWGSDEGILARN